LKARLSDFWSQESVARGVEGGTSQQSRGVRLGYLEKS